MRMKDMKYIRKASRDLFSNSRKMGTVVLTPKKRKKTKYPKAEIEKEMRKWGY